MWKRQNAPIRLLGSATLCWLADGPKRDLKALTVPSFGQSVRKIGHGYDPCSNRWAQPNLRRNVATGKNAIKHRGCFAKRISASFIEMASGGFGLLSIGCLLMLNPYCDFNSLLGRSIDQQRLAYALSVRYRTRRRPKTQTCLNASFAGTPAVGWT